MTAIWPINYPEPQLRQNKIYAIKIEQSPERKRQGQPLPKPAYPLEDGPSKFQLDPVSGQNYEWRITMREGRNRQIRRTFKALGYQVTRLHRERFGSYKLRSLQVGSLNEVNSDC